MSNILPFTRAATLDELWSDYQALVRAQIDTPALAADREHVQATIRAYQRFAEAYGRDCAQVG